MNDLRRDLQSLCVAVWENPDANYFLGDLVKEIAARHDLPLPLGPIWDPYGQREPK